MVYITTDRTTQSSLHYLAQQIKTPTTLSDKSRFNVLPNASDGPAVPLVTPYTLTAIRPCDQLFVAFALPGDLSMPALATIEGQFYTITPYNPSFGPLHLETDQTQDSPKTLLRTIQGEDRITTPLA